MGELKDEEDCDTEMGLTFPALPIEVIDEIFKHLPTSSLLECRIICQLWHLLASRHCRNRYVSLKLRPFDYTNDDSEEVYNEVSNIFINLEAMPWSALECVHYENSFPFAHASFLQSYGEYVKKIKFNSINMDDVLGLLEETPNVECVSLQNSYEGAACDVTLNTVDVTLGKLKQVQMGMCRFPSNFLGLLVKKFKPKLNFIDLRYDYISQEDLGRTAKFLSNIPNVHLQFRILEDMTIFGLFKRNLFITKFQLSFEPNYKAQDKEEFFKPLELFLSDISTSLKELCIGYRIYYPPPSGTKTYMRMPVLPLLKHFVLKIGCKGMGIDDAHSPHFTSGEDEEFIIPFTSEQFPSLVSVHLVNFASFNLFTSCQLKSVTKLEIAEKWTRIRIPTTDWAEVFPAIKEFKSPACPCLLDMLRKWTLLENVCLTSSEKETKLWRRFKKELVSFVDEIGTWEGMPLQCRHLLTN